MARTVLGMCALWRRPRWYVLGSRSWHTLKSWTTILWNIIQIQLGNEELWPGHGFWICVHCDLDLGDMTLCQGYDTSFVIDSVWNIIQIQLCSEELWPGHGFWVCVHCDLILGHMTLGQGHDTSFGHRHKACEILSRSNLAVKYYPDPTWQWGVMARTRISGICALWPWPWRYDLVSRSWHILGPWTIVWNIIQIQLGTDTDFGFVCTVTLTSEIWPCVKVMTHPSVIDSVWNIIQIQLGSEELWPGHGFWVCVHCDLILGHMTLGQGHDTSFGHRHKVCEILSRSNLAVRSYGPDTDFRYMCTVTLTLEIWPCVKVMTHPWVMDNCVKYYPDPTWQWGVMARTRISSMCALWPWPWRYDLGSRSWYTLWSWTTIVWNIIQI